MLNAATTFLESYATRDVTRGRWHWKGEPAVSEQPQHESLGIRGAAGDAAPVHAPWWFNMPLDRDVISVAARCKLQAALAACADRTQRDHYVSSAGWWFGCDSSRYGPIVDCVTNILVVALLPDKD